MDFAMGFPRSRQGHDIIWVLVNRLTKSVHFLLIKQMDPMDKLAQGIQQGLGTKLHFSTAFHPQTDGCYQSSIGITPYKALYGRKCRTPLTLTEVGDRQEMGSTFIDETVKKINMIKERLKAAHDRQQRYYIQKDKFVEFQVGDFVYVKVSPIKGVNRFGRVCKLSPRYVGPFEIIERIGKSAYRLLLPDQMSDIHNIFHVSSLRKWMSDSEKKLSAYDVEIQENLQYKEEPKQILAYDVRKLRNK
ncbi:uncharacterized protein LOC110102432 [Dendrobium catenatum]|uniref:uncharacterized protein LOC110102432 n=1 Tax=Dendrobium catenatum TaxID=906689 RepID=UPI0009F68430|nr:uncharacterized protein LOC110102432 [Dendrobium catenatum]